MMTAMAVDSIVVCFCAWKKYCIRDRGDLSHRFSWMIIITAELSFRFMKFSRLQMKLGHFGKIFYFEEEMRAQQ